MVSVIDGSTRKVVVTVAVGKYLGGLAVDPGNHAVYVTNSADDSVSVIDTSTNTVTATLAVGQWPDTVAVDPATHSVYVGTRDPEGAAQDTQPPSRSGRVSVIDGSTRTVVATVPIGKSVDAVAVDSATDTVYVAKFADDTVSVIDGSKRAVTATVSMGHSSLGHGVAVDPDTHAVYVTSFNDDTVSVIELAQ